MGNLWNRKALDVLLENLKKTMMSMHQNAGEAMAAIPIRIPYAMDALILSMKLYGMRNQTTVLKKPCSPFRTRFCILRRMQPRYRTIRSLA